MASIHAVSSRLTQLLKEVPGLATGPDDENKQTINILVVVDESLAAQDLKNISRSFSGDRIEAVFTYITDLNKDTDPSTYYAIFSGVVGIGVPYDLDLFSTYTRLLTPGGVLVVKTETGAEDELVKLMKTCGLLQVTMSNIQGIVFGRTPSYKVGYSDKITFNTAEAKDGVVSAWKLDDNNVEMISEDDLLEADDLEKPASSSLRVCATTKKAKACKDCSCGLAEELEANRLEGASNTDNTPTVKSSCGSCYLGDAFRCSTCPYLGMPAFKPGEKVKLAGNLLQDDF